MTGRRAQSPSRARLALAFLALYLIWGSTYLAAKTVVADVPPLLTGALRNGIAGLILYGWARGRGATAPTRKEWGVGLLVGTMLLAVGNGSVNFAMTAVPSGLTALLVSSVPIWMVLIDWWRPGGEAPHGKVIAGLVLGVLGIAALVWSAGGIGARSGTTSMTLIACTGLLLGSLSWAGGSILSRHLPRHQNGLLATAMEQGCAAIVLLATSVLIGETGRFDAAHVHSAAWWSLAYLTVGGSIIAFSAYTWLLRVTTPANVATYAYVNPLIAVALGSAVGGEPLTRGTIAGAALILGAVVMITLPRSLVLRELFDGR